MPMWTQEWTQVWKWPWAFTYCVLGYLGYLGYLGFVVGGLGFEFCELVAGWRHALQSEWPFIIIIIIMMMIYLTIN